MDRHRMTCLASLGLGMLFLAVWIVLGSALLLAASLVLFTVAFIVQGRAFDWTTNE